MTNTEYWHLFIHLESGDILQAKNKEGRCCSRMKWRRTIVSLHPIKNHQLLLRLLLSALRLLVDDLRACLASSCLRSTVRLRLNCSC